jgi:MarR family transcriptional regulator, multiple antibiotic resistance protein MarR
VSLELEEALGWKVGKANLVLKTYFQNKIRETGLAVTTEQWAVLHAVAQNPRRSQTEIGKISLRDKTVVTRILDILERNGWILRSSLESDRRVCPLELTEEGLRVHEILSRTAIEANDSYRKIMGEDDWNRLRELLDKLAASEALVPN